MPRLAATGPHKDVAVRRMRRTAAVLDADHPEMIAGDHVRDAARVLARGSTDGAKRHLDAAMELLTPRNLIRHGITDDEGHATAKHHLHQVHRHRLHIEDIEDIGARNEQARQVARARRGEAPSDDDEISEARLSVELAGPKGYVHGWIKVTDAQHLHGKIIHGKATPATPLGYVTGRYNSLSHTIKPRNSSPVRVSHVAADDSAVPAPVRRKALIARMQAAGGAAGGFASSGAATELAFYDMEPRDARGQWTAGPVGVMTGKRISRSEAAGFAGLFGVPGRKHQRPGGNRDKEARQKSERAALTKPQRKVYDKLRARGRQHKFSLQAASMPVSELTRAMTKAASLAGSSPALLLSARTAQLERTPAPRGKPGGPGLYHVKGLGHTPYLQQIVKALIEKRGMPEGKAYAIARAAIRKWRRGGGHVHPEVAAAAGRAEAGEQARQAQAHAHAAGGWDIAGVLVELAATPSPDPAGTSLGVIDLFNPYHAPPGAGGGRFTAKGGAAGQQKAGAGKAGQRRKLLKKAAGLRAQIRALEALLRAPHHGHPPGRPGKKGRPGKARTAPARKGAAAVSARQARQGKAAVKAKAGTPAASPATIRSKIIALRAQLRATLAQLRAL